MAHPRRPKRGWLPVALLALALLGVSVSSCGGGLTGQERRRARTTLITYLGLVRDGEWRKAIAMQDDTSDLYLAGRDSIADRPRLVSFAVGRATGDTSGREGTFIMFPVDLVFADHRRMRIEMQVGAKVDGYPDTVVDPAEWPAGPE
jgi:hypothetical protein